MISADRAFLCVMPDMTALTVPRAGARRPWRAPGPGGLAPGGLRLAPSAEMHAPPSRMVAQALMLQTLLPLPVV